LICRHQAEVRQCIHSWRQRVEVMQPAQLQIGASEGNSPPITPFAVPPGFLPSDDTRGIDEHKHRSASWAWEGQNGDDDKANAGNADAYASRSSSKTMHSQTPATTLEMGIVPGPMPNPSSSAKVHSSASSERLVSSASEKRGMTSKDSAKRQPKSNLTKAHTFLSKSRREWALSRQNWLQRVVNSRAFEWTTGSMILVNAVFMGASIQYYSERAKSNASKGLPQDLEEDAGILVLQATFAFLFGLELAMRWTSEGLFDYFRSADASWNIFDMIVVIFGFFDILSSTFPLLFKQSELSNTSVLRVMRVLRIVRVVRVIRIMRFFRELRMMIFGLLGCVKSLCWALMVLVVLFFMFGISLTAGTLEYLDTTDKWSKPENQELIDWFSSLDKSVLNLYMSMSGGRDWGDYYDVLEKLSLSYRLAFLIFLTFAILAVINIVTGIFVESAHQCNQADRETMVQEELAMKETYRQRMRCVFEEIDNDGTGRLSLEEFEKKLDDERVIAYFDTLKLDVSDARKLFTLLDFDRSGEIDVDEFLNGCQKLKGESRALDLAMLSYEVRWISEVMANVNKHMLDRSCGTQPHGPARTVTSISEQDSQTRPPSVLY